MVQTRRSKFQTFGRFLGFEGLAFERLGFGGLRFEGSGFEGLGFQGFKPLEVA